MGIILAENSYGESRVRLLKVSRQSDRHILKDLDLAIQLCGSFEAAHTAGDNRTILSADSIKNAVFALAKNDPQETGEEQIEQFALRLAEYFMENSPQASQARVEIHERPWSRIALGGKLHRSAFTRDGGETRTALITATRQGVRIAAGLQDLTLLKTDSTGFAGFQQDPFSPPVKAGDGIVATAVKAEWLYGTPDAAFGPCWHGVRQIIVEAFAEHQGRSTQHTLYALGETLLNTYDDITEIRLALAGRLCRLTDLSPFGLENHGEVFEPADEPHTVIEATIRKK